MKKIILLLSLLISVSVFSDAVIFSGSDVKTLKPNIDLFGTAKILTTSTDPSAVGLAAPKGSIALNTSTGTLYLKTGALNTDWTKNQTGPVNLASDVTGVLPIVNGGTGSSTQNFVDLSTVQSSIGGAKTFTATLSAPTFAVTGTSGNGYMLFPGQSAQPAAPAAGNVLLHGITNNGFTRLEHNSEALNPLILGQDNIFVAKNVSGAPITIGQVVYVNGSTGAVPNVTLARSNSPSTIKATIGVATEASVANGSFGQFMTIGILYSVNTNAFNTGDVLYVDSTTAGALTNVKPVYPNYDKAVGIVLNKGVGNGSILINTSAHTGGSETGTDYATFTAAQFVSNVVTGTAPFQVASTTKVTNLYADRAALADTVTTNANLTGPITSVGNATSVASQTGTGSKFVMDTSPTLVTPNIGVASGTSLTTTGNVGVGAAVSATSSLNINPTINAGNTQYGVLQNTVFGSGTTSTATGIWSRINTAAAAFTLTDAISFDLPNLSKGAGSTVTNSTGLMVRDQTQATNNYGIQNAVSSGANKWAYYGSGTANNAFAGNTRFGSTAAPTSTVDITGTLAVSTPIALASGGTGASTKTGAFDSLSPMTTGGDIIYGGASGTGTRLANGSNGQVLTSSGGTSAPAWTTPSPRNSFLALENISFAASVAGNALTIALKDSAGADPSAATSLIGFRSSTLTSGAYVTRTVTAATSITISSGSTLGHTNGIAKNIWLYAIDNAGTVELAVSSNLFDESYLYSTTAEGGAGAADSESVLYSTTARTNVAIRLIGRLLSTQTTAGTWATVPTDVSMNNHEPLSVSARYTGAPPTGTISSGSYNLVTYTTKVKDSHNKYSSGVYTVPVSGTYFISAKVQLGGTFSPNQETIFALYVDGVAYAWDNYFSKSNSSFRVSINEGGIPLLAGQTVSFYILSQGTSVAYSSGAKENSFSITRTGNY